MTWRCPRAVPWRCPHQLETGRAQEGDKTTSAAPNSTALAAKIGCYYYTPKQTAYQTPKRLTPVLHGPSRKVGNCNQVQLFQRIRHAQGGFVGRQDGGRCVGCILQVRHPAVGRRGAKTRRTFEIRQANQHVCVGCDCRFFTLHQVGAWGKGKRALLSMARDGQQGDCPEVVGMYPRRC